MSYDSAQLIKCETCGEGVMADGIHRFNPGGGTHICSVTNSTSVYPSTPNSDIDIEMPDQNSGNEPNNPPCAKCGEIHDNPENVYHADTAAFEAVFAKILVVEDEFRSGYECAKCNATGQVRCESCEDGYSKINAEIRCKECEGTKLLTCPDCQGKKELIVVPDTAKRRPTTGLVVSIGAEVNTVKRGWKVLYPSFCGEVMDLNAEDAEGRKIQTVVRMLQEKEIVSRMTGDLELRRVSKQQFNVGG